VVCTEAELDHALTEARKEDRTFCLLDVQLDPHDRSPALQRLADRLAMRLANK